MSKTETISNLQHWSCKRCQKTVRDVTVTITGSSDSNTIFISKINPLLELYEDCNMNNFKIDILNDEIREKKEIIKGLTKELRYHKDILKRYNEKLLNLEFKDFQYSQD